MVIRQAVYRAAVGFAFAGLGVAISGEAFAQANVLKECGSQYQAAKAANELAGQTWQDFLKACRARIADQGGSAAPADAKPAETKPAEAAAPAAKPAETAPAAVDAKPAAATPPVAAKPETAPNPAPAATTAPAAEPKAAESKPAEAKTAAPAAKAVKSSPAARQKKCAAEWKAKKAELLKENAKLTWPKFWSGCNKRLKEAGE